VRQQPAIAALRPLGRRDSAAALAPTEELEAALAQQQEVKGRHALAKGRCGALAEISACRRFSKAGGLANFLHGRVRLLFGDVVDHHRASLRDALTDVF
jgi:hypothetical protein